MKVIDILEEENSENINQLDVNGAFYSTLIDILKDMNTRLMNGVDKKIASTLFIFSMSENRDSLTLFSSYSNFDGYNIGFKFSGTSYLKDPEHDNRVIIHGKVNYHEQHQISIIKKDILSIYNTLFTILEEEKIDLYQRNTTEEILMNTTDILKLKMSVYAAFFKNPSFSHEEEYRIVVFENKTENIIYRVSNTIILPYIEVSLDFLPIQSITVGPKNNVDIAIHSIENYLNHLSFSPTNVNKSEIPLRY